MFTAFEGLLSLPLFSPTPVFVTGMLAGVLVMHKLQQEFRVADLQQHVVQSSLPKGPFSKKLVNTNPKQLGHPVQQLSTAFVIRIMVLRAVLVGICAYRVQASNILAGRLMESSIPGAIAASIGLLAPLLGNLLGLLWPLVLHRSFHQHCRRWHQWLAVVCVACSLLQNASGWAEIALPLQSEYLVYSLLFIVHQDHTMQYCQLLACMVVLYTPYQVLATHTAEGEVGRDLDLTNRGIMYMLNTLLVLVLHFFYRQMVGPRVMPRSPMFGGTILAGACGCCNHIEKRTQLVNSMADPKRKGSDVMGPNDGPTINYSFIMKLGLMKLLGGLFLCLYAVKDMQDIIMGRSSLQERAPALTIAVLVALNELVKSCLAFSGKKWYMRQCSALNRFTWLLATLGRLSLILMQPRGPRDDALFLGSFFTIGMMLVTNNDPFLWFFARLTGTAAVYKACNLWRVPERSSGGWFSVMTDMPEYIAVVVLLCILQVLTGQEKYIVGASGTQADAVYNLLLHWGVMSWGVPKRHVSQEGTSFLWQRDSRRSSMDNSCPCGMETGDVCPCTSEGCGCQDSDSPHISRSNNIIPAGACAPSPTGTGSTDRPPIPAVASTRPVSMAPVGLTYDARWSGDWERRNRNGLLPAVGRDGASQVGVRSLSEDHGGTMLHSAAAAQGPALLRRRSLVMRWEEDANVAAKEAKEAKSHRRRRSAGPGPVPDECRKWGSFEMERAPHQEPPAAAQPSAAQPPAAAPAIRPSEDADYTFLQPFRLCCEPKSGRGASSVVRQASDGQSSASGSDAGSVASDSGVMASIKRDRVYCLLDLSKALMGLSSLVALMRHQDLVPKAPEFLASIIPINSLPHLWLGLLAIGYGGRLLYLLMAFFHTILFYCFPLVAARYRTILWTVHLDLTSNLCRVSTLILGVQLHWSAHFATFAFSYLRVTLDMPPRGLYFGVAQKVLLYYDLYCMTHWNSSTPGLLALLGLEFCFCGLFGYAAGYFVCNHIPAMAARVLSSSRRHTIAPWVVAACQWLRVPANSSIAGITALFLLHLNPMGPSNPASIHVRDAILTLGSQPLPSMLTQLELVEAGTMAATATLASVGLIVLACLAFLSCQTLALVQSYLLDPHRSASEQHHKALLKIGELGMQDCEDESLIAGLHSVVGEMLGGTTVLMALLDEDTRVARYHTVLQGEGLSPLTSDSLPLTLITGVRSVLTSRRPIVSNDFVADKAVLVHEDLHMMRSALGAAAVMVMPLAVGDAELGALLVLSELVDSMTSDRQQLTIDLAAQISQALYLRRCVRNVRVQEEVITDIMPKGVAEHLKRKAHSAGSARQSLDCSSPEAAARQALVASLHNLPELTVQALGAPLDVSHSPVYKQWHPNVTVLFADIVGYTSMSQDLEPEQVMLMLHDLFSKYDELTLNHGVYKVETIGDCYMAATGLLAESADHASEMVEFGKAMIRAAAMVRNPRGGGSVNIRVGIHSGRVMSGIVGQQRARYCLFGDTVNTASRMESTGVPGTIQISEDTYQLLLGVPTHDPTEWECRGQVPVKGKGVMQTYLSKVHEESQDFLAGMAASDRMPTVRSDGLPTVRSTRESLDQSEYRNSI